MIDERFPDWEINVEEGAIYSLRFKKNIGSIDRGGYVKVYPPKGYKHKGVHQYIWIVANGNIPEGYDVHHIDGNKLNNSICNLELVEHKKHISEHKKGHHHTEETKNKIGKSHKGKILSEEHIRKLSKQVMQYTLEGELVKIWCSTKECGRNGFDNGNVSKCCNGKLKTHKGFIWKYYEEQKDVA